MLEWHVIPSATYYGAEASALNDEYLYFLSDTGEIYKGAKPFTDAVEFLSAPDYTLPAAPARRRIYINPTNMEGKVYDGSAWQTVIKPVVDTVSVNGTDPVNSKAVIAYVAAEIAKVTGSKDLVNNVTYSKEGVKLNVSMADGSSKDLVLEGLGVSLDYDDQTGALTLKDVNGAVLGSAINLDLERFVSAANYDDVKKEITLSFNDASTPLVIPVGDLVDTYTAKSGKGVSLTVSNNEFTAEAIVAATEGNLLQLTETGLYVAASTFDAYNKLIQGATDNHIVTTDANGQVKDSGLVAGTAALSGAPNATTLATEQAVQAAITAAINSLQQTLTAEINKKMNLVTGATQGNIATYGENGQVVDSSKAIGGAELAASPNANTVATEAAVKKAVDDMGALKLDKTDVVALTSSATANQAASAKATYDALTWKTTL